MKTAFLLRHGDADGDHSGAGDHSRPLNARGQAAVDLVGSHLAERVQSPLLVFCSSAQRTMETLERVRAQLDGALRATIDADLYLASSDTMLEQLQGIDDRESSVLVIAHNPGIASLAASLVAHDGPDVERMHRSFPSAALAEIEFDLPSWSQIGPGSGALRQFTTPADLA